MRNDHTATHSADVPGTALRSRLLCARQWLGITGAWKLAEETWHEARLIPTSGISGADEQERRATSALLAVITAVREFGRSLLQPLGAPAGNVHTFIEVPF